jgi:sugar lactone lactonase YvrE
MSRITIKASWAATYTLVALACAASGCGGATPEPASSSSETSPAQGADLAVAFEVTQGPGNITVTPEGQVIVSLHQFYEPEMRVARIGPDGALEPFAAGAPLDSVLGIQSDGEGVVWMLDNGMRSGVTPKLVAWASRTDTQVRVIELGEVVPANAFVNDLVVDSDNDTVYIADPAGGANAAIVVVDLQTGGARRVLEGHESVVPEDLDLIIDGTPVRIRQPDGSEVRPRVGINPIAADTSNEWLYYGPMHGRSMYRVRTSDLRDAALSADELAKRVERWADKPICDGISMDSAGNIYISDLAANAIGVIDAKRQYRVLVSDPRLSWPDAFSYGPDQRMYTVANQLHRSATLNAGTDASEPPYRVLTFRPLAPGMVGR